MAARLAACVVLLLALPAPARQSVPPPGASPGALDPQTLQHVRLQVTLDRAGYSPGEIDGALGSNTERAREAFERHGGDTSALVANPLATYAITEQDAAGPFTPEIPDDIAAQADLPALNYRNVLEMLGERFHTSPVLLRRLNAGSAFAAGDDILVPDVLNAAQPLRSTAGAVTITVSRAASSLIVTDASQHVLFFAPVTTGSEHDPLPIGTWKVTGIQRDPEFHYNPDLFWDADPSHSRAVIQPGPNNPVGLVWIDIDKPHYGLHGTPEPSEIGKVQSHGCVRMTNWDALTLASLARTGTTVVFTP